MAVAVVDQLEIVQVDHDDGQPGAFTAPALKRVMQLLSEKPAVAQPGERIAERQLGQLCGHLPGTESVGEHLPAQPQHQQYTRRPISLAPDGDQSDKKNTMTG